MKPIEDTGVAVCAAPSGTGVPRGVVTLAAMQDARILIVDDEFANVRVLERLLTQAKLPNFRSTTDSRQAIPLLEEFAPDIVLLDLHMPHRDGFSILQDIRRLVPAETFLPVLVLTSDATAATRLRALDRGATDFLTKPLDHAEVLLRIRNLLLTRQLHLELAAQNAALEEAVRERTADLRQRAHRSASDAGAPGAEGAAERVWHDGERRGARFQQRAEHDPRLQRAAAGR